MPLTKALVCLAESGNTLTRVLQSAKPRNELVTKPCHPCGLVDVVKGQWMNSIPHIIPHILVRKVINEECVLQGGSSALETIQMLKKSVQGFDKVVWSLCDRSSVEIANYIALILVKGATSLELLRQTWSASTLKRLEHGFEVLLIAARPEGHLETLHTELQELSYVFPKCVEPVTTIRR